MANSFNVFTFLHYSMTAFATVFDATFPIVFHACIHHVLLLGYDTNNIAPHIWQHCICGILHFCATFWVEHLRSKHTFYRNSRNCMP